MTEADAVSLVNGVAVVLFWLLFFAGAGSTLSRVAYYRAKKFRRPRLLVRDALFVGGLAMSFGLILLARGLRSAGFDTSGLANSLAWNVLTCIPALVAVGVYVYFEVFVIERGKK